VWRDASGNDSGVDFDSDRASQRRWPLLPIFLIGARRRARPDDRAAAAAGLRRTLRRLPVVAASLVPARSACELLSGPVLGNLSDRVGRRRVLLLRQAGTFVDFSMTAGAHGRWKSVLTRG
jgi:hypothetical protein